MLAAVLPSASNRAEALPQLRDDISFADVGYDISGDRSMILHDPVQQSFLRLSSSAATLLEHFRGASSKRSEALEELSTFLQSSRLLKPRPGLATQLAADYQRRSKTLGSPFLYNYISFRLSLFNPESFLDWSLPLLRLLATRCIFVSILILMLVGIYFASRQWDHFFGMLTSSFTLAGATSYAVTIVVLKIFHELGHAYVARHYGCRVPSIGIAFMVLTPMLYTDVSDAWRLSSRRQRVLIGAAGILVDLSIAAIALFLWAFLPDGVARSVAFFVAVTAWLMSVIVNLSPFMRFDGYHIMVDVINMHNLGPRSFALANWRLREFLFKPNDAPPEFFAPGLRRFLICFAFATWAYRLSLFLGIAYVIYTVFPKAAGIPLCLVEIHFFILRPALQELKEWKGMGLKKLFTTRRAVLTAACVTGAVVLAFIPLDRNVHVPAVFLPVAEARLYPSEAAQVIRIEAKPGTVVLEGQVLAQLFVPDISRLQRIAQLRLQVSEGRLQRVAVDAPDLAEKRVLEQERATAQAELDGLRQRGALLVIRAPIAGVVSGDAKVLRLGQWVAGDTLLFHIADRTQGRIIGLVAESEAGRLGRGADVKFVAEDGLQSAVIGRVENAGFPGTESLAASYLSSQFGGPIAVRPSAKGGFEPMTGRIPLMIATGAQAPEAAVMGTALVAAEPQSFASFLLGRIVTVFMRESGR